MCSSSGWGTSQTGSYGFYIYLKKLGMSWSPHAWRGEILLHCKPNPSSDCPTFSWKIYLMKALAWVPKNRQGSNYLLLLSQPVCHEHSVSQTAFYIVSGFCTTVESWVHITSNKSFMVGIGSTVSPVVIYFVDNFYGQNLQAQLSGGCERSQDLISGFSKCCGSLGFIRWWPPACTWVVCRWVWRMRRRTSKSEAMVFSWKMVESSLRVGNEKSCVLDIR